MRNSCFLTSAVTLSAVLFGQSAFAQDPTGGSSSPAAPDAIASAPVAPSLKEHPDPIYPPEALKGRIAGTVGLELTIDESGQVLDVKVVQPGGHGFDEAALAAVKSWTFEPARQDGKAIRSTIQLALPFVPPPPPAADRDQPTAVPAQQPSAAPPITQQNVGTTLVLGRKPISAASSSAVRDRDFALRPIGSVQDILRVTPGLVMVQHSGGGKANQYFLRGFDADHGTDVALSIDGIPINMVSHAHGQGFADTNF
ncbi:MAG: TonB family protein, partial [Dokdonella sp.]